MERQNNGHGTLMSIGQNNAKLFIDSGANLKTKNIAHSCTQFQNNSLFKLKITFILSVEKHNFRLQLAIRRKFEKFPENYESKLWFCFVTVIASNQHIFKTNN